MKELTHKAARIPSRGEASKMKYRDKHCGTEGYACAWESYIPYPIAQLLLTQLPVMGILGVSR